MSHMIFLRPIGISKLSVMQKHVHTQAHKITNCINDKVFFITLHSMSAVDFHNTVTVCLFQVFLKCFRSVATSIQI